MHPILAERRIFGLYLVVWLVVGVFLALLLNSAGSLTLIEASVLAVPMVLVYSFMCLASYYLCRSFPFHRFDVARLLIVHAIAAGLTSALWVSVGKSWVSLLAQLDYFVPLEQQYAHELPILIAVGISLFLLSVAISYALIAFRESREAERQAMELRFLAQEAELRALRSQINPHFLFNSLNSISALTTTDPPGARTMTLLLADFLRRTLSLGAKQLITVNEEVGLALNFLEIEQVRFGSRLKIRKNIDARIESMQVPPLLLQPLVENAVGHGIANLIDGGEITISASARGSRLFLSIDNPCDPEHPRRRGQGIGLENVRNRLRTLYAAEAKLDVHSLPDSFHAEIMLPAVASKATMPAAEEMHV